MSAARHVVITEFENFLCVCVFFYYFFFVLRCYIHSVYDSLFFLLYAHMPAFALNDSQHALVIFAISSCISLMLFFFFYLSSFVVSLQ